jgi:hypothetical protein
VIVNSAGGAKGTLMSREVWVCVGYSAPMFVVQTMFLFIHAGNACPRGGVLKDDMLNESYFNLNQVRL